ncbi:hypothetical protein JW826_02880 [Candidatus Woesearchaeota archaeon]|nr:hypothetical protein [Candidatus Woesearchaeota archaeon]
MQNKIIQIAVGEVVTAILAVMALIVVSVLPDGSVRANIVRTIGILWLAGGIGAPLLILKLIK